MDVGTHRISLTGPDSHELTLESGMGLLTIRPESAPEAHRSDLIVDPDQAIDWTVFDAYTTPAGSPWPRWLTYIGNDVSVLDWARTRQIEGLSLRPQVPVDLDASGALISSLSVHASHPMTLKLGSSERIRQVSLIGDLDLFDISAEEPVSSVALRPVVPPGTESYALPPLPGLHAVTTLTVVMDPLGPSLDCASLRQFSRLESLSLQGALTRVETLAELDLVSLAVRYVPDLSGLPDPTAWPRLTSLIAWNVDEVVGRRLREQVKALDLSGHVSVSKLRSPRWFAEEYGLPFSGWTTTQAAAATKAFRSAGKKLAAASTEADAKAAIVAFVEVINDLEGIATAEREDAWLAVDLLAKLSAVPVSGEQIDDWFDEAREF